MRELDDLLLRYLETRYPLADEPEKAAFRSVLELSDPELNGYLLQGQQAAPEAVAHVIRRILSQAPT